MSASSAKATRVWRPTGTAISYRFPLVVVPWAFLVASDALSVVLGVPWQTRLGKALVNVFCWRRAYCMRRNFLLIGVDSAVFTNFFGVLRQDRQAFGADNQRWKARGPVS